MNRVRVTPEPAQPTAYDVIIEAGSLSRLAQHIQTAAPATRYALITDSTVKSLHGDRVLTELRGGGLRVDAFAFPSGERYKTAGVWESLIDRMVTAGFGRDACVIALGGGVVGDVAGFVAATYHRGIPCVQVPTTLLSMLDAAIGGKTGVDARAGKNLIGSFLQPKLVLMDPTVLWTQRQPDLVAGAAEAVKHGAIADAAYLQWIGDNAIAIRRSDAQALEQLVQRSVEIKAAVVSRDAHEKGERAVLNFGHTIAHALEAATHYEMSHGHAVARGLVVESAIGESLGVTAEGTTSQIINSLALLGLTHEIPRKLSADRVLPLTTTDKKARNGRARYVLLERIGQVAREADGAWTWDVDPGVAAAAVTAQLGLT